ncbi:hypothetical protein FRC04_011470 [Tulasnella sp. 424]|nr:hypothetical protein FRC04_011470 [Tulasnella sp. 424]KAG8971682.1 hypothetical protein FRC05_010848 [Tulasnella sp. 425]
MWKSAIFLVAASLASVVSGLGSSCTAALTPTAAAGDPHWMQTITRRGKSAYNANPSTYKPYRNVKDYGAKGDGVTDDTAAINKAISDQNRCGQGCASSTLSPGIIFFPSGTYLVSTPIIPFYLTQLVGDAKNKPTLLASAGFNGMAVIDADPYIPNGGGAEYWDNTNNFFKSVRHFKIDTTRMPATTSATGVHWQVAQATTLVDIEFDMNQDSNTAHQGIWMENGSGGFMSDLTFNGGKFGMWVGNQQFTVKNIKVRNCQVGVYMNWNWGWTFQGVDILNSGIGFQVNTGGTTQANQSAGTEVIIDGRIENVQTFVKTSAASIGSLNGALLLDNIQFINVGNGVVDGSNAVKLAGGTTTVRQWAQGNKYWGTTTTPTYVQTTINAPAKPTGLLDTTTGYIYSRSRTDYPNYAASQFASVRDAGAVGDGVTDDTTAIQNFINKNWGCKILFFDAGSYYVTNTITIPTGTIIVGEVWTTVIGGGSNFSDQNNPRPVIKVGNAGDKGVVEISDMVFSTRSGSAGAIVIEWNVADTAGQKATAAMWDVHIRLGGYTGSGMQAGNCLKQSGHAVAPCTAAYIGLHITSQATGYFEGTWVWTADHDLDDAGQRQIDIYTGRGIVSESANGPVWLIGTASEHAAIVQYSFVNSKNVYAGLIQTETAYYQPSPGAPSPFTLSTTYHDPTFTNGASGWALNIANSQQIYIYGAGHYSFFSNYDQGCLTGYTCQTSIVKVGSDSSNVYIYGLSTVGTTYMLNVDGTGIIKQSDNRNGFASTATIWTSTTSTRKRMRIEGRKALANDSLADIAAYARM